MPQSTYQQAKFTISCAKLAQLPKDSRMEVAFAGRSNAGKSSSLNTLTQQRKLAHTSKTPGRTQLINYFELGDDKYLVDLPGYGYAKVSIAIKQRWQQTLSKYLEVRDPLRGLVVVMDSRHPMQPLDCNMVQWALESDLPVHVLLTKADKLSKNQAMQSLMKVKKALKQYDNADLASAQLFSSLKRTGVDELVAKLDQWYADEY